MDSCPIDTLSRGAPGPSDAARLPPGSDWWRRHDSRIIVLMTRQESDHVCAVQVPESAPALLRGGFVARVPLPPMGPSLAASEAFAALHSAEQALISSVSARRACELLAGRVALRSALRAAGWTGDEPILPGEQGRPTLPPGFSGSITHKDGLALAFARAALDGVTVGMDSEVVGTRERSAIAARILRSEERRHWEDEQGRSWPALLERFSMKEAIYKALHPHVPRYIGFDEAEIAADGGISLTLAAGEGPFTVVGWSSWEGEGERRRLVSLCGARPC